MGAIVGPIALVGVILTSAMLAAGWVGGSALGVTAVLCLTTALCGVGVLTLQGWCSGGRSLASAGLLAACGMGVFLLSCPRYLGLVSADGSSAGAFIVPLIADSLSFLGIVIASIATPIIVIEVLLRWVSSGVFELGEGVCSALRCLVVILFVGAAASLIQEEGLTRLLVILERMGS